MKFLFSGLLIASLAPFTAQGSVADDAKAICSIVDRYERGSYHYFDCLNHIESIDPKLTVAGTIDFVCSAVDTFYSLDEEDKVQCFKDAAALLNPEPLACYPATDVLSPKFQAPQGFDAALVIGFQALAGKANDAYRSKVYGNNGLVSDLQIAGAGCFAEAYGVSLDGPEPLQDALKECVFTDINAYSDPAVTAAEQNELAKEFSDQFWGKYLFRKVLNASLQNDPITAFNTRCVLEIRSLDSALQDQRLYLAGYTID